jgi:dTDP-N-acetylfucosamine:lipid II N-acetylfucosaminyltransferase
VNILHLARDEKFILFLSSVFGTLPDVANRYLIQSDPALPFKHVQGLEVWRVVGKDYFSSEKLIQDLAWADCLIVHYLDINGARMILKAPAHVVKVWSGWGGDYYQLMPGGEHALLGEETALLMKSFSAQARSLRKRLRALARSIKYYVLNRFIVFPALRRVDYFSAPIEEDYFLLKRALGRKFSSAYSQLNYGSVEQTFLAGGKQIHGNNILIGNSATPTNNHLETFKLLSAHDLANRKLIVPLSYGIPEYRDAVIAKGRAIFGDQFVPLCDYLALPEYNKAISQCSVVIMNQRRQQALGNIGTMLYRGAKVFLEPNSPVYRFLKSRGAHVYSTSLLQTRENNLFTPLDSDEISTNKEILESIWGHDIVTKNAKDLILKVRLRMEQGK